MEMKVELTKEESEKMFLDALCNGSGELAGYGISIDYTDEAYAQAKKSLENPCREDVWMQILKDGNELTFLDAEDEDNTQVITIKDVHEKVQKTPHSHLMDMINENDDAITSDCILQTVIFGDVIYG
jgi:hypothetical protein